MDEQRSQQRGYLREPYRLFHLSGSASLEVENHYHEFHKLVFFRSGRVTYAVEGLLSDLQSRDIVLVPMGCVHRVEAASGSVYERSILYIAPDFLRRRSQEGVDLERCFALCREQGRHVLRPAPTVTERLWSILQALEQSINESEEYGAKLLSDSLLCQLLIGLTRETLGEHSSLAPSRAVNSKAVDILRYINENLTQDISIENLSERFFISKYHMMRSFRAETGFTIHGYIAEKRLLAARELIAAGKSAAEACYACGYKDYSAFSRAFKKQFGVSPRGGAKPERRASK